MLLQLVLWLFSLHKTSQMPAPFSKVVQLERMFDITEEDTLNIKLAETVGVTHLAVSYPQGVNCTLIKTVTEEPRRVCENITIPVCSTKEVVRLRNITEDCREKTEYCEYSFRTEEVTQQTVICQRPADVVCSPDCSDPSCEETYCEKNSIVVCSTVHQTVAITEKKQQCGAGQSQSLQTTKICFTYPDARWACREPRADTRDCSSEIVRMVSHEVAANPQVECTEKELEPLCLPGNCRLRSNNTDCLTTDLPKQIKLNNQKCEPCVEGRTKLRPLIVEEEICEEEEVREICSETLRQRSEWTKRCSMPADMKLELIEQVLLSAEPPLENEIDRITFRNKTNRGRQESKIVRMRVPPGRGQGGPVRVRSKVNFQFVSKTTTSRPPGLPYVFADILGDQRGENRPPSPPGPTTTRASLGVAPAGPANTRRYAQRFPVRPAPVNGLTGTKPWRSSGVQDSEQRFPFLAWQNEDITEEPKYTAETDFQSPVSNREQFFENPEVKNQPDNKKLEEAQLTDVLQNAIFSNDKNYVQLYKDLKNGNYNSGTGLLRHQQDKKSDNSGNYDEQVTSALENAISLYPYTDYTELYKDSLANSPTTSQPFIEVKTERFPATRNPASRDENFNQQFSAWNNFQSEEQASDGQPKTILDVIDHRDVIGDREPVSGTDRVPTEVPTEVPTGVPTEQYYATSLKPTEETEAPKKDVMTMCANIEDKQEMIRCKLIACWKDNQYCY